MTLRELAGKLLIGAAANNEALHSDLQYQKILATEFNLLVPEWAMKCHVVCSTPNKYNFKPADTIIDLATKNNQQVRGHVLCWHLSSPIWMRNLTSLELEKALRDFIFTIVDRYKGKCTTWDVLNEAINDKGRLRKSIWTQVENYIQKCFLWAHQADPDAHLIYLDYRVHTPARWNTICKMIDELKQEKIPIHGIGLQMHHELYRFLGITAIRLPGLIQQLKQLDLSVHFSEISIPIYPPTQQLPPAIKYPIQGLAYGQLMKTCLESNCSSFTVWGFTDKYAYYKPPEYDKNGTPCLFDANYQPKSAYFALEKELNSYMNKSSPKITARISQ